MFGRRWKLSKLSHHPRCSNFYRHTLDEVQEGNFGSVQEFDDGVGCRFEVGRNVSRIDAGKGVTAIRAS
jgi:hypothetical protein